MEFIDSVKNLISKNYYNSEKNENMEKEIILCNPVGHRFVKSFVTEYEKYEGEAGETYKELLDTLYEICVKEMALILPTRGIFVVIGFLESSEYKDQVSSLERK